ncbi:MAG: glycosyltransferase involved in cell wall biosynthesis [Alphaproteobacteria bacterium]|jgi:glycosyltransferase involved in cell wall biosynthesis
MSPEYSIVIACYNSSAWIADLVAKIEAAMVDHRDNFELILVNDASPDGKTWQAIVEMAADHRWVRGLDLQYNVGQFMALMAGFDMAQGANVITMDDDLQHPPAEIPRLIRAMAENPGSEVVIGKFAKKEHDLYRNLGSSLMHNIYGFTHDRPKRLKMTNFRIMKRAVVDTMRAHRTTRPMVGALLLQSTKKIINIDVEHHPRPHGKSGYSLLRLINTTLDSLVYSSTGPLRLLGLIGFGISAISGLLGLYYFFAWVTGTMGGNGFITLVLLILLFGGAILFGLGMIGEYIARILKEVVGNPRYVVRDAINLTDVSSLTPQNTGQIEAK